MLSYKINLKLFIFLYFVFFINKTLASEIALSIDDVPMSGTIFLKGKTKTKKIIDALKINNCPPVGIFVLGINTKFNGIARVAMYQNAKHIICNHSYSHFNLNKIDVDKYIEDIKKADILLNSFFTENRIYRYPYLATGNSISKRTKIQKFLKVKHYKEGYVTIKTTDYLLNELFLSAVKNKKKINFENLKKLYLKDIEKCIEIYSNICKIIFGKEVKHIILLHENDLLALFMSDLIDFLKSKQWKIIPIDEAYNEPIITKKLEIYGDYETMFKKELEEKKYDKKSYNELLMKSRIKKLFENSNIYE